MKVSSKLIVLGLYSAYLAGCSVEPSAQTSGLKQSLSSGCAAGSSSSQAIKDALHTTDCGSTTTALSAATSLTTQAPVDAEMLSDANKLVDLQTSLVEANTDLQSLKDMANLQSLSIFDSSLQSLKGIEGLSNLKTVFILSKKLKSIDVTGPTNVTSLWIDADSLETIENLKSFTKLESLYIFSGKEINLSAIAGLPNLKTLWVKTQGSFDLASIKKLPAIKDLMIYNDSISDLSGFEGLRALDSLTIKSSSLKAINGIANSSYGKTLQGFQLVGTGVTDVSDIASIATLNGLAVVDGKNVKVPFASLNSKLSYLNTSGTTLDLTAADFSGFSKLSMLSIDASNFPLAQLQAPALNFLTTNQAARSGSDFANFPALETMTAESAGLSNISGLANKPSLATLGIKDNKVVDYSPLENSEKLKYLDMSYNQVPEGFAFPKLSALDTVYAGHNNFVSLANFKRQKNLFELDLSYTKTTSKEISGMFYGSKLGEDRALWLSIVHCQGIEKAQDVVTCHAESPTGQIATPTLDTIALLGYKADEIGRTLQTEREHITDLEKLKSNQNVGKIGCLWATNHIRMINQLETVFSNDYQRIVDNYSWKNPSVDEFEVTSCDENVGCDIPTLSAMYHVDINVCFPGGIDEITSKKLSQSIVSSTDLQKLDQADHLTFNGRAGVFDSMTIEDEPAHEFLSYLISTDPELGLAASQQGGTLVNIDKALSEANEVLTNSLQDANDFLGKIKRIEDQKRDEVNALRKKMNTILGIKD